MKEEREAIILLVAIIPALLEQYVPIYSTLVGAIVFIVRTVFFPPVIPVSLHWILVAIYFSIAVFLFLRSSSVSLT